MQHGNYTGWRILLGRPRGAARAARVREQAGHAGRHLGSPRARLAACRDDRIAAGRPPRTAARREADLRRRVSAQSALIFGADPGWLSLGGTTQPRSPRTAGGRADVWWH